MQFADAAAVLCSFVCSLQSWTGISFRNCLLYPLLTHFSLSLVLLFSSLHLSQDAEFIYRGSKLQSVMDFVSSRIKKKYPQAKILMSADPPTQQQLTESPQYIPQRALPCVSFLTDDEFVSRRLLCPVSLPQEASVSSLFPRLLSLCQLLCVSRDVSLLRIWCVGVLPCLCF